MTDHIREYGLKILRDKTHVIEVDTADLPKLLEWVADQRFLEEQKDRNYRQSVIENLDMCTHAINREIAHRKGEIVSQPVQYKLGL